MDEDDEKFGGYERASGYYPLDHILITRFSFTNRSVRCILSEAAFAVTFHYCIHVEQDGKGRITPSIFSFGLVSNLLTGERGVLQGYNSAYIVSGGITQVAQSASQCFFSITESRRDIYVQNRVVGSLFLSRSPSVVFLVLCYFVEMEGASVENLHRYLTAGSLSLFLRDTNTHFEHVLHHGPFDLCCCGSCGNRSLMAQAFDRGLGDVHVATWALGGPDLPCRLVQAIRTLETSEYRRTLYTLSMVRSSAPFNPLPANRPGDAAANMKLLPIRCRVTCS